MDVIIYLSFVSTTDIMTEIYESSCGYSLCCDIIYYGENKYIKNTALLPHVLHNCEKKVVHREDLEL
jgi:hypothetical protein